MLVAFSADFGMIALIHVALRDLGLALDQFFFAHGRLLAGRGCFHHLFRAIAARTVASH